MAYNLQSLITILEQILNPQQTHPFVTDNKPQLESLLQKAVDLGKILDDFLGPELESLGSQIGDAIYKAEGFIESHMLDQVDWWRTHTGLLFPAPDLQQVMEEFDSATEQAVEIVEGLKAKMSTRRISSGAAVWHGHLSSKKVLVGVDKALLQLRDELISYGGGLRIVSIVGMIGIGKTALAQELYEDQFIEQHFDIRLWITITQDCDLRAIMLGLLDCICTYEKDSKTEADYELGEKLHRRLFGRKYVIFLDNMWTVHCWDAIRRFLPVYDNGSRIIITTRNLGVARDVGSHYQYEVQLMSQDNSWNLLQNIVFGEEYYCPPDLEFMGRKIASDCDGLPLAVNMIGRHLSIVQRSIDAWETIANTEGASIALMDDDDFYYLLSSCYNNLPNHLKRCLFYMEAFPKDYQIKGSRLIRMWVAEGFVKSNGGKSLEEEAEYYLESLVERNLFMVTRKKSSGKPMCYGIHGFFRNLCRRKSEERLKRGDMYALPLARSFICTSCDMSPEIVSSEFMGKPMGYSVHGFLRNLCRRKSEERLKRGDMYALQLARFFICTGCDMWPKIVSSEFMGKPMGYSVHGFLRNLCRRKSEERLKRGDMYAFPLARSFIYTGCDMWPEIVSSEFMVLRLLRVLDVLDIPFKEFPVEVLELVNLRYLAFSCSCKSDIPKGISRLLNLQTLIGEIMWGNVAAEIWEMSELRHLQVQAELNFEEGFMKQKMPENLQTISSWVTCDNSLHRMGFFKTIPNIKNLAISFLESGDVVDLQHLHKLRTLNCKFDVDGDPWRRHLMAIRFPNSLRKLSLQGCLIFGRDLTRLLHALPNLETIRLSDAVFENVKFEAIGFPCRLRKVSLVSLMFPRYMTTLLGALPNLKVLKLSKCVFEDEEFALSESDVFRSLESPHLEELNNLVRWRAEDMNFPSLRELVIRECPMLEEIPIDIGDIPTLELIELCKCSASLEASARRIKETQEECGNEDLQVKII